MSAADLLDRLQRVKKTGERRWRACCPAHQSRNGTVLSVREIDDGTVLVKCFAGCGALDVLTAVGLDFQALFPPKGHGDRSPSHSKVPARDLLKIIDEASWTVWLIATELFMGKPMTQRKHELLVKMATIISNARLESQS